MTKNKAAGAMLTAALLVATAWPALAQHHDYHGRNFGHFSRAERDNWRGGRWIHDWHGGRYGWWWSVDGGWYFYPQPVYPYPTIVPPAIVVQPAPPANASWYYCDNPAGYYPTVPTCSSAWREVPATPPHP
jgi:hypothetical protein